ncbi:uncharacterized protein [Nicotiana tomentosiformis]|uniref:uncharacterized protein n=1 Tax=Nicotiana tomentosiformis TaxID=4098 RepID=UPI00388C5054
MYHDIRGIYWWDGMKKDIVEFVVQCPNYQQVKIEHQKPGGLLQAIVDEWVFLKVSPMKGVMRFGKKGKLSPQYIGPYKIIRRVGQVIEKLSYEEAPIAILDRQVHRLRTKDISSVKVLWRNNNVEDMTWKAEEDMKSRYPHLFPLSEEDRTETSLPLGTYMVLDSYVSYCHWSCEAIGIVDDCGLVWLWVVGFSV